LEIIVQEAKEDLNKNQGKGEKFRFLSGRNQEGLAPNIINRQKVWSSSFGF